MKKLLAFQLFILTSTSPWAAQFGSLTSGTYKVFINGSESQTVEASEGVVSFGLPGGSFFIGLSNDPEGSQIPSEGPALPALSDTDQEVFLTSFDETTQSNRFTLLDRQGLQVVGPIEVLQGVESEGKVLSSDLDGDGRLEVLAAGYVPDRGVVLEYWNGEGILAIQLDVFDGTFDSENHLVSADLDGEPGNEAILIGRDSAGAYHVKTYNAYGEPLNQYVAFSGDYAGIESILIEDVRGNGREEAVVLVRTVRDTIEMKILTSYTVLSSAPLFGSGSVGPVSLFPIDVNGDGASEIGAARKNLRSDSHRLMVSAWDGNLVMKSNILSGKYQEEAVFCAADLDGDSQEEIGVLGRLVETGANVLEILDDTGNPIATREVLAPSYNGALTVLCADLNTELGAEIVVGGKDSITGTVAYQVVGQKGDVISGGAFFESGIDYQSTLFLADIDMDGDAELLAVGEYEDGRYGLEMRDGSNGLIRFSAEVWDTPMELAEGELIN